MIEYCLKKPCYPSCLSLLNPLSSRLLIKSYLLSRLIYQAILSLSKLLFPSTDKSTSMENCCMTCSLVCSSSDSFVFITVTDRSITGMPTMYVTPQPLQCKLPDRRSKLDQRLAPDPGGVNPYTGQRPPSCSCIKILIKTITSNWASFESI